MENLRCDLRRVALCGSRPDDQQELSTEVVAALRVKISIFTGRQASENFRPRLAPGVSADADAPGGVFGRDGLALYGPDLSANVLEQGA